MLKIQFKDRRKPAMWLVDSSLKLGSGKQCDILIEDPKADEIHASLLIDHDDLTLSNHSTSKAISVNDVPVTQDKKLVAWDVIKLGDTELEIIDPLKEAERPAPVSANKTVIRPALSEWLFKANSAPLAGQFFQVSNGSTLGRDENADIVIPLSLISRFHAKIILSKGKIVIEDTNSSHGTYVNGERINSCELRNNDQVKLDEFLFTVIGPEDSKQKPRTVVRDNDRSDDVESAANAKKTSDTKNSEQPKFATEKVFLHEIDKSSSGKVYEIVKIKNHLSKMLGHHLSRSEKSVSARHIYLNQTNVGWEIVNNGAADGLLVNDKMQIRAVLQDGDEVLVGGTRLKFQSVGETPISYFTPKEKKQPSRVKWVFMTFVIGGLIAAVIYFDWLNHIF